MSQHFPKPFRCFGQNINVDISKLIYQNYATKTDPENVIQVGTSSLALKTNLVSLKTQFDKLDIDKLAPVPADANDYEIHKILSRLDSVIQNPI